MGTVMWGDVAASYLSSLEMGNSTKKTLGIMPILERCVKGLPIVIFHFWSLADGAITIQVAHD